MIEELKQLGWERPQSIPKDTSLRTKHQGRFPPYFVSCCHPCVHSEWPIATTGWGCHLDAQYASSEDSSLVQLPVLLLIFSSNQQELENEKLFEKNKRKWQAEATPAQDETARERSFCLFVWLFFFFSKKICKCHYRAKFFFFFKKNGMDQTSICFLNNQGTQGDKGS